VVRIERDASGRGWHVADRALTDKHVHRGPDRARQRHDLRRDEHGSLFASDDDGRTWQRRDKGLTEHNVYSLACARLGAGARVFVRTEPAHLFYSDDLGRSWSELAALRSVDTSRWSFPAPPTSRTPSTSIFIRTMPIRSSSASSRVGFSRAPTPARRFA
jgi:photosystem II stability/assembly factor-like uncharacterized protein